MTMYLSVGIGGIIGALLRFFISQWFLSLDSLPFIGTIFVNLTGCFLLGYLQGISRVYELPGWFVVGIGTGLIGAYTTFSTFSMEVVHYLNQGLIIIAFTYIVISSVGGYFLAYTGFFLSTHKKREV